MKTVFLVLSLLALAGCGTGATFSSAPLPVPGDVLPSPSPSPAPSATPSNDHNDDGHDDNGKSPDDAQPALDDDEIETALACVDVSLIRYKSGLVYRLIGNNHAIRPIELNQLYKHNGPHFKCVFSINALGQIFEQLTES